RNTTSASAAITWSKCSTSSATTPSTPSPPITLETAASPTGKATANTAAWTNLSNPSLSPRPEITSRPSSATSRSTVSSTKPKLSRRRLPPRITNPNPPPKLPANKKQLNDCV